MNNLLNLMWVLGKNIPNQLTIRQLAKNAKVPYATAYRVIDKNQKLFNITRKGNIKLCSLNLKDSITKNYLILAERQQAENFLKKEPELRILEKELPGGNYTCILFGSRAEGVHREKSDIDLCMINKDGSRKIKLTKYERLFKVEINTIYFSQREFTAMLKEKEHNLAHEIIKKHIILHGEEYFWNTIFITPIVRYYGI